MFVVATKDNVISRLLFLDGHYQLELVDRSFELLRRERLLPARGRGTILDIGANNGVISIGALVTGEVAKAIGLEPDPGNFALLQRNIENNGLCQRFVAVPLAASDTSAKLYFELSPDNLGDHRIRSAADEVREGEAYSESSRQVIQVDARPLDEILESLPGGRLSEISLVWMDVQGHEGRVLAGGSRLFSTGLPVVTEVWPYGIRRSGGAVQDFCSIAQGYWPYFWVWHDGDGFVKRPTAELVNFCEELDSAGSSDDIVFTRE